VRGGEPREGERGLLAYCLIGFSRNGIHLDGRKLQVGFCTKSTYCILLYFLNQHY